MTTATKERGPERTPPELPKAYRPSEVEPEIYQRWLAADVFAPDGAGTRTDATKEPFVIVQPPPNVNGSLHQGHALTGTVEDVIVRRARMQGHPTLWLPGMDHASIAAQVVLDRILAEEGETRQSLGRERYLERMWRFVEQTRKVIAGQQRRLGLSADWSRERFTMDEGSARAVRTAFKQLYDDGRAYRAARLINWCPTCRTSLSDLEVIATPATGTLWTIRYHLLDDDGRPLPDDTIEVATTRPETILGDTGVAVHPDDDRYRHLVGRGVLIPFVDRPVPIVADAIVERDFGTGAVKVTPAHDHEDSETGKRHGLPAIDVMEDDGRINAEGGPYAGLSREEARERIVADLRMRGDLVGARDHEMIIGRCQRTDDIVEPRLKGLQWFIDVRPLADRAVASVRHRRTRFVPVRFEKVFFDWMERIHDWNVSRQLWWGHRIPAWYCPDDHVTVSDRPEGPDACAVCKRPAAELRQDEDIFDTWFSSGLWPFSTLGWPEETLDYRRYYPTTVMETGYDIIFFWVARMMMLGEWLTGSAPFRDVYLHGMVRDPEGRKMSKTRGNVIDPLGVLDDLGADVLRFALVHGSAPGADQRLGPTRLEGSRNFANKLWNAARFVLGARPAEIPADDLLGLPPGRSLGAADHWILWRCRATIVEVDRAYAAFQFGEAARLLHDAIWSEYCDWYLEVAKVQLGPDAPPERRTATWQVLSWVLDRYLRLLHPVTPFITESIWDRLPHLEGDPELLIVARWPAMTDAHGIVDEDQAVAAEDAFELVRAVRNARAEAGIAAGTWLAASVVLTEPRLASNFPGIQDAVERLARIRISLELDRGSLEAVAGAGTLPVMTRAAEARLARADADLARDRARLERELADATRQLAGVRARLDDRAFVDRAPGAVVDGARAKATELEDRVDRLAERLRG